MVSQGRWVVGVMVSTALALAARPTALAGQPAAQRAVAPPRDQVAQFVAEAPTISEVELAPDGSCVVYTVARGSVTTNQYVTDLWLQPLDAATGAPRGVPRLLLRRSRGDVPGTFTPRRCPDSRCLTVFVAAGDSGLTLRGAPAGSLPAEGGPRSGPLLRGP